MTENKNGNVLEYRIGEVENKIDNHEKNCQKDREKKDKEFQEYREKMEERFDKIEHDFTELNTIVGNIQKDVSEIKEGMRSMNEKVDSNKEGVITTNTKLWTIGSCIVVGLTILGVIIKFLPI